MNLSSDLISEFAKVINEGKTQRNEVTVYGTISVQNGVTYVKIDGSDELTPVVSTVGISDGERVMVTIKQHQAVVTGNLTDPSVGVRVYTDSVNGLNTTITETAEGIRADMTDSINGLNTTITTQAGQIDTLITQGEDFSSFQQTVECFSFMGKGGKVKISGGDLNLTGSITFSDFDEDTQGTISDAKDNAEAAEKAKKDAEEAKKAVVEAKKAVDEAKKAADEAKEAAEQAEKDASDSAGKAADYADSAHWDALSAYDDAQAAASSAQAIADLTVVDEGVTYIDGSMIYSGSIYADAIRLGGTLTVYEALFGNVNVGGYMGYTDGFNSNKGIGIWQGEASSQCVCTNNAARLSYANDASVVCNSEGWTYIDGVATMFEVGGNDVLILFDHGNYYSLRPSGTSVSAYLGNVSYKWEALHANTGTIQTSDRNNKNSIEDLPEMYSILFDNLTPRRFKMNDGTSDRYHVGYIAQEVEDAMKIAGVGSLEFAGFIKDKDDEGNDIYMLRYDEFGGIYALKLKQLEARYEAKISDLEARLSKLEERLGRIEEGG